MSGEVKEKITRTIKLPLYYTGITKSSEIKEKEGKYKLYQLNCNYEIELTCVIEPESYTWFVIE